MTAFAAAYQLLRPVRPYRGDPVQPAFGAAGAQPRGDGEPGLVRTETSAGGSRRTWITPMRPTRPSGLLYHICPTRPTWNRGDGVERHKGRSVHHTG